MRRRLFNIVAAVSLVLCCVTLLLWARSYWVGDVAWVFAPGNAAEQFFVGSLNGVVTTADARTTASLPLSGASWQYHSGNKTDVLAREVASHPSITIPYWALTVTTVLIPLIWLWRAHGKRRRVNAGRCATCDYDLRATPDRCPECGTQATQGKPQAAEGAAA